jgi:hypothetical protein
MKAPQVKTQSVEEGNYVARVCRIIYMGTVEGEYKGEKNSAYKVSLTWELPTEMKVWKEGEEPKPVFVSKIYTLSMAKKASLRPVVEGIVGGMTDAEAYEYDLDDLIGKVCLLNITYGVSETGKEKQNIGTSKLIKGMTEPDPITAPVILSYTNWNEDVFLALPEFMRKEMEKTVEYRLLKGLEEIDLPSVNVEL